MTEPVVDLVKDPALPLTEASMGKGDTTRRFNNTPLRKRKSDVYMRAVLQRVTSAAVVVDQETVGQIGNGLLVLLGVADGDTEADLKYVLEKTVGLRIFADDQGKMNLSVKDIGGSMLVVSQFTLLADVKKGRRPSFNTAADPGIADDYYQQFVAMAKQQGIPTETGVFAADMKVSLCNDGPVTIILDSHNR